jgi:hypothetical protein
MAKKKPKFDVDFRKEYPTLKQNINGEDVDLTADEYEATIAQWELNQAAAKVQYEAEIANANTKAALLEKLGITADEAKLLLG